MTHEQFTYWLQGFVEMNGGKMPTESQWKMIEEHLKTCFNKVTPTQLPLPTTQPPSKILRDGYNPSTPIC